jgi:D-alanyl-D-alanine carboxypeptidase
VKTRIIQGDTEPAELAPPTSKPSPPLDPDSGWIVRFRKAVGRLRGVRRRGRESSLCAAAVAVLAAAMCVGGAAASSTVATSPSLQPQVDALVAAGAPGAILLVRNGTQTRRFKGGLAEIATKSGMNTRDHYRIASLTKTYVAAVVLQLVAEHKLRLGDSVERWLPGLVPKGDKITIHQLLNHTSGLYDHEKDPEVLEPYVNGDLAYYWSPLRLVKLAVTRPARFAPGATKLSSYSSTNYLVLGLIVERVTGNTIGGELKRRIFKPLRLTDTSYPLKTTQLPSPYAHGYFLLGQPPLADVSAFSPSLSGAAGAIVSTVDDVADFYRALLTGRVLKPAQLKAMKTTIPEAKGDLVQRMGYGLIRFSTSCGAAWGHSGSFPGYWTHAWTSANGKRQVVLMVNIDPEATPPGAAKLFYKLLDNAYCSAT